MLGITLGPAHAKHTLPPSYSLILLLLLQNDPKEMPRARGTYVAVGRRWLGEGNSASSLPSARPIPEILLLNRESSLEG